MELPGIENFFFERLFPGFTRNAIRVISLVIKRKKPIPCLNTQTPPIPIPIPKPTTLSLPIPKATNKHRKKKKRKFNTR